MLCVVLHTWYGSQLTLWSWCHTWCVAELLLPSSRAHLFFFFPGVSSIQTSRIWLTKLIFSYFFQWLYLFSLWTSWGDVGVCSYLSGLSLSQSSERSHEFLFNRMNGVYYFFFLFWRLYLNAIVDGSTLTTSWKLFGPQINM